MPELEILDQLDPQTRNLVLRVLLALLALFFVWLLRRLLTWLVLLPFSRILERRHSEADDIFLRIVENPVRLLVIAPGIFIAGALLPSDEGTVQFFSQLARSFIIMSVFAALYNGVGVIVKSSLRLEHLTGIRLDEQLVPFLRTGLRVVILALAIVILLQEWDYDVSGLIAGIGLGGLAISLAAQDTVANLFSFTTIISDKPLRVGEFIRTPSVTGIVEEVGVRAVRIRQLDQALVTVPNTMLTGEPVVNFSRMEKRRLDVTVGVTYDSTSSDLRALVDRLRAMLRAHDKVDAESVSVFFSGFGDSSLNILIRCNVTEPAWADFMEEQHSILLTIMDIIEDLGLSVAFPSRTLYIESMPEHADLPDAPADNSATT